tara:strand:+ start:7913 stop:8680 length:768 start_codon:yes stop_codon:yes gene_type:complete
MFASRGGFINGSELATVTGGTLTYDGLYSVRTFTSNGNLTIVDGSLNTDRILVVGAGGNGGTCTNAVSGGGGGGGEVVEWSGAGFGAAVWPVYVGSSTSGNGSSSVNNEGYLTAVKGSTPADNSQNGGTSGNGFAGGNDGPGTNTGAGGGGGGASVVGGNAIPLTNTGGTGGAGVTTNITGANVVYGGGGGGGGAENRGEGGAGGGGYGATNSAQTPQAGTTNTGGGGGGAVGNGTGAVGGSGIVIFRYLTQGTQ